MTLWNLTKKSYKEIYNNISSIFLTSFLWFFTAGVLIFSIPIGIKAKFYFPILLAVILVGPTTAGAFYITNKIVNYHSITFKDFFIGARKYFFKSIAIILLLVLIISVIGVDFNFFLNSDYRVLNLLSAIWIYVLIFLMLVTIYIFPLMIELDNLDEEYSIKDILKYAFLLALKKLGYTLFIFLNILIFGLINIVVVIGLPVLFIGGISLIANNATINLLLDYNIKEKVNGPYNFR